MRAGLVLSQADLALCDPEKGGRGTCLVPHRTMTFSPPPTLPYSMQGTAARGLFTAELGAVGSGWESVFFGYDGEAWLFWFVTQDVDLPPRSLPDKAYVCSAGAPVSLRASPAGQVIGQVPRATLVTASTFRLSKGGSPWEPSSSGVGWYRITTGSGTSGWIAARYLSRAGYATARIALRPPGPCEAWLRMAEGHGLLP